MPHGLLYHHFMHQVCEGPISIHQLSLWTHKVIRKLWHTPKEGIFKYPVLWLV